MMKSGPDAHGSSNFISASSSAFDRAGDARIDEGTESAVMVKRPSLSRRPLSGRGSGSGGRNSWMGPPPPPPPKAKGQAKRPQRSSFPPPPPIPPPFHHPTPPTPP